MTDDENPTLPESMNNDDADALRRTTANALQQVRFHMERAERFRVRAEKAEAELNRPKEGVQ